MVDSTRMSSARKVIIGLGSIWGLWAFGVMVVTSFTIGANDTAPEVVAIVLYGFTVLPACLLAIRFPRASGSWLVFLSFVSGYGFAYQAFCTRLPDESFGAFLKGLIVFLMIACIPGVIGGGLLWIERNDRGQQIAV